MISDLSQRCRIYKTLLQFPDQFLTSYQIVQEADLGDLRQKKFGRVFVAGMGGSSLPTDLVNDYLAGKISLIPIRDYQLPQNINQQDLLIGSSFSGNTEETHAAVEAGVQRGIPTVIMTHGGRLKGFALEKQIPWIRIPDCIQPRCANGFFFASLVGLLERLGLLDSQQKSLQELSLFLKERQAYHEATGKNLADALVDRIPIIYGPPQLAGACRVWKIKLNENAKIQSFYNVFPELNHNEMVGFTRLLMKPAIIYLQSQWMHPGIHKRMKAMQEMFEDKIPIHTLTLAGENALQEIFDSLGIGDFASYYLAKAYGIDPAPVEMVEEFKRKLSSINPSPS